jgi:putative ABC transport system ATP-binding protein
VLEARQLGRDYRAAAGTVVVALDDVSLAIAPGSFTVLTGPSGSGKTTLLALLGGLERPTRGGVFFSGRDLARCADAELARLRRRFGFVFQDFALIPDLAVWENVSYPLIPRGVGRGDRYRIAVEWLERLGLKDRIQATPRTLSGGEQQRVALARAFAGDPEIVFADEPTSNLDAAAGAAVIELLQKAHADGKTVVASAHDERLIAAATTVVTLRHGRVIAMPEA